MGVDGCWCAPWSSKPVRVVSSCLGGFDSHILPPTISGLLLYRQRPLFMDTEGVQDWLTSNVFLICPSLRDERQN